MQEIRIFISLKFRSVFSEHTAMYAKFIRFTHVYQNVLCFHGDKYEVNSFGL
jgi:hypothetical protein